MGIIITGISLAFPKKNLTHEELQKRFGVDVMDRLLNNTQITNRKVCSKDQCASDLGFEAAKELIKKMKFEVNNIDLLIFTSQTPDYLMPTTACILQEKLGLKKSCAAFDINLGCSQFVYAHSVAYSMIKAGIAKKALIITADTPSKIINPKDKSVVPLFGDAASACILEEVEEEVGYIDFELGTDGSEHEALIWPNSGMKAGIHSKNRNVFVDKEYTDKLGATRSNNDLYMNGQKIFLFTLNTVPRTLKILLENHKLEKNHISFFAIHQASGLIVDSIANKLKLKKNQYNKVFQKIGNSGGSTVGISLFHAIKNKNIKKDDLIVMTAFGVGLSWGHSLYKTQKENIVTCLVHC